MVDKATLVISFPEKEFTEKRLEIVPHENTVEDVAEALQDAFQCGEDRVCVLIKPSEDKYLSGNLTIEELNIHTGGYKLWAYLRYKSELNQDTPQPQTTPLQQSESQETEVKLILCEKNNPDREVQLGIPDSCTIGELKDFYKQMNNLRNVQIEMYKGSDESQLLDADTLKQLCIASGDKVQVKRIVIGA